MWNFTWNGLDSTLAIVAVVAVMACSEMAAAQSENGFYFRNGITVDRSAETRFKDRDCRGTSPAALYGCGKGVDGARLGSRGDFGTMVGFVAGAGYVVAPPLRLETTVHYRPGFNFAGSANFVQTTGRQKVAADLYSLSGIVAAYLDLPGRGSFYPVIGSGAGLTYVSIGETQMDFARTTTIVPRGRNVNFTLMLTAGVAVRIWNETTLDCAWRYIDSGDVETGRATGRVVWRDGSREPLKIDLAETRASLSSHGLRVSLRYTF